MCQLVSLYLLQVFSAAPEPNLQPPTQICEINCLPQTCGNHREVKLIKLLPMMISKDDIPTPGLGFLSCGQVGGVGVVWWGSGAFLVYVSCFYSGGWGLGRKELRVEAKKTPKPVIMDRSSEACHSWQTHMSEPSRAESCTQRPLKPSLCVSPSTPLWLKATTEGSVANIPNLPRNEEGPTQPQP